MRCCELKNYRKHDCRYLVMDYTNQWGLTLGRFTTQSIDFIQYEAWRRCNQYQGMSVRVDHRPIYSLVHGSATCSLWATCEHLWCGSWNSRRHSIFAYFPTMNLQKRKYVGNRSKSCFKTLVYIYLLENFRLNRSISIDKSKWLMYCTQMLIFVRRVDESNCELRKELLWKIVYFTTCA